MKNFWNVFLILGSFCIALAFSACSGGSDYVGTSSTNNTSTKIVDYKIDKETTSGTSESAEELAATNITVETDSILIRNGNTGLPLSNITITVQQNGTTLGTVKIGRAHV